MGLPPIEPSDMARFMEAAFDDVAEAVRFVKARHGDYGVDPERIVLGGFSAGGRCACYATYGKRIGVAGTLHIRELKFLHAGQVIRNFAGSDGSLIGLPESTNVRNSQ